jgi:hypothetical protein
MSLPCLAGKLVASGCRGVGESRDELDELDRVVFRKFRSPMPLAGEDVLSGEYVSTSAGAKVCFALQREEGVSKAWLVVQLIEVEENPVCRDG